MSFRNTLKMNQNNQSCSCHCRCRQIARKAVNILNKKNIKPSSKPVKLSLSVMRQFGATPVNLNKLYSIGCIECHNHNLHFNKIRIFNNFEEMLELLYTTRRSECIHIIQEKIKTTLFQYSLYLERELGESLTEQKQNELTNIWINKILNYMKQNGFIMRYKPGILYSLYEWARSCECCKRHKRNFPIWEPWNTMKIN